MSWSCRFASRLQAGIKSSRSCFRYGAWPRLPQPSIAAPHFRRINGNSKSCKLPSSDRSTTKPVTGAISGRITARNFCQPFGAIHICRFQTVSIDALQRGQKVNHVETDRHPQVWRVDGNPVGTRGPRHHGGQHPGIALGVHHQPFLRVKERPASLQHEALDQLGIGFPDVQEIVVRVSIAINVAHQRPQEADKIVPGFNGGDIDPCGLDEVRPVGEKDRVDIMGQAENAPAGRPGRKRRRIDLLVNPLDPHDVGQVDKAHVLQRPLNAWATICA